MAAIEAEGLTKRFGPVWALRECSFAVPSGSIVGLMGPNGAGKTTLLHIAVGLLNADAGSIRIFGRSPQNELEKILPRIGFVPQDRPLYKGFTVEETLKLGRRLNPGWDETSAREALAQGTIPLGRQLGQLSKGQQAQVALSLALGKRAEILLLDEPLAGLDPLARRGFLQALLAEAAQRGTTVVLTSHVIADVERVCDHLIVLGAGTIQLAGPIDRLVHEHVLITAPRTAEEAIVASAPVIAVERADRQIRALLGTTSSALPDWPVGNGFEIRPPSLEEIVFAYLENPQEKHERPEMAR
jgi:ABC-2 type transport system ATP-binding protein